MMNEREVISLTYKLYQKMLEEGYPLKRLNGVKISRARSFFGKCTFLQEFGFREVNITITKMAIVGGYDEVKNTILHELCHACCEIGDGHGAKWKLYARKVSREFNTNITIEREENEAERKYLDDTTKYRVVCDTCGYVYKYQNRTKFIRQVELNGGKGYRCHCGGKHFHIG